MNQPRLDAEQADRVYSVLVQMGGAYEANRPYFVQALGEGCSEYRFMGVLGFGGKFRGDGRRWYVDCYSEDLTPRRQQGIDTINERLREILEGPR